MHLVSTLLLLLAQTQTQNTTPRRITSIALPIPVADGLAGPDDEEGGRVEGGAQRGVEAPQAQVQLRVEAADLLVDAPEEAAVVPPVDEVEGPLLVVGGEPLVEDVEPPGAGDLPVVCGATVSCVCVGLRRRGGVKEEL